MADAEPMNESQHGEKRRAEEDVDDEGQRPHKFVEIDQDEGEKNEDKEMSVMSPGQTEQVKGQRV